MPAQNGSSIVLGYGPQGSRQLGGSVLLDYRPTITPRTRISGAVRAAWQTSAAGHSGRRLMTPVTQRLDPARRAPWGIGQPRQQTLAAPWIIGLAADRGRLVPWRYRGLALPLPQHAPWGRASAADRARLSPWGVFELRPLTTWFAPWGTSSAADRARLLPWAPATPVRSTNITSAYPASTSAGIVQWVPWVRYSRPLSPGWGVVTPPGPAPDPDGTFIVPTLQVYVVINTLSLVRLDTGQSLPALAMSLSLDCDSWTWSFSATLPASTLADVQPVAGAPVVLQATINGVPYRVMVESIKRDRRWGADRITIQGRGLAAELAAPYSPELAFSNPTARTAQQLLGDVLSDNGVPLDWSVDWQIADWLVPSGAWSLQGSRMDAVAAIASAAGAFVLPHPVDRILRIRHRYPSAPWDWATTAPAFELPANIVQSEGTEWVQRPVYNRVFVSGQRSGVLGQVTRDGTAGDLVAPMVTDSLITHADAARQRGLAILANVGRQALRSLRLPVLDDTGIIEPGQLVRYIDGSTPRLGLVRSTQVDAAWTKTCEAWQTINLETHGA